MNKRQLEEQRIEFSNQKFLATPLAGLVKTIAKRGQYAPESFPRGVNMLRKMPQYSTLGGQHPPECQSNPATQGTFTTQKHSGTEGSACSGISRRKLKFGWKYCLNMLFKHKRPRRFSLV